MGLIMFHKPEKNILFGCSTYKTTICDHVSLRGCYSIYFTNKFWAMGMHLSISSAKAKHLANYPCCIFFMGLSENRVPPIPVTIMIICYLVYPIFRQIHIAGGSHHLPPMCHHPQISTVLCGPEGGHVLFVHLIDFGIFDRQHDPSPAILLATNDIQRPTLMTSQDPGICLRFEERSTSYPRTGWTNIDVQNEWFA